MSSLSDYTNFYPWKTITVLNKTMMITIIAFNMNAFLVLCFVWPLSRRFWDSFNPVSPSQLSVPNFASHNTYKKRSLVMRKWDLIKQSKLLKIKSKILLNWFNEKYGLKLGEFNNTTGTERINKFLRWKWINLTCKLPRGPFQGQPRSFFNRQHTVNSIISRLAKLSGFICLKPS